MIVLVPIDGNGEDGAPLELSQSHIRVGHGPHNDLRLDAEDEATSYEHAMLSVLGNRAVVVCDPTAKPTYIEGADVTAAPEAERELKPGDIISFGKGRSIFRVRRIGEVQEPPRPPVRVPRLPESTREQSSARGGYPITFQVMSGDQLVREESFTQPLIRVGRMKSSHLLLVDESVSRTHAVVEVTAEQEVLLMDLDSSSGTAVNGTRVKKASLKSGDQVEFGKVRVIVSYGKVAASAAPEPRARPTGAPPPPIPRDAGLGPASTQVLSASDLEALDGPRLVVRRSGVEQGEFVLTKPQTTIGRLPENDIQLDDGAVSSKHAMLVAEAGVYLILDQHSTNGTYLNGERCTGESLRDGDVIQIGRFELVFTAPRPAQHPPKTEVLSAEAARAMFAKVSGRRGREP
jgi:pSer/pThr/pTyr-binding forkhead associated (FHA) protein